MFKHWKTIRQTITGLWQWSNWGSEYMFKKKSVPQKNLLVLGIKIKYSDYTKCFAPKQLPFGSLHIMVSTLHISFHTNMCSDMRLTKTKITTKRQAGLPKRHLMIWNQTKRTSSMIKTVKQQYAHSTVLRNTYDGYWDRWSCPSLLPSFEAACYNQWRILSFLMPSSPHSQEAQGCVSLPAALSRAAPCNSSASWHTST